MEHHLKSIVRLNTLIQALPDNSDNAGVKAIADDMARKAAEDLPAAIEQDGDSCLQKAKKMPSFTLVATDPLAEPVIDLWMKLGKPLGVSDVKISGAGKALRDIERWRAENPDQCKIPD